MRAYVHTSLAFITATLPWPRSRSPTTVTPMQPPSWTEKTRIGRASWARKKMTTKKKMMYRLTGTRAQGPPASFRSTDH